MSFEKCYQIRDQQERDDDLPCDLNAVSPLPDNARDIASARLQELDRLRQENQRLVGERDQYKHEAEMWDEHMGPLTEYEGDEAPWQTIEREFNSIKDDLKAHKDCLEVARSALNRWHDYFQGNIPRNADEQEAQGEEFTKAWYGMIDCLATINQLLEKK